MVLVAELRVVKVTDFSFSSEVGGRPLSLETLLIWISTVALSLGIG